MKRIASMLLIIAICAMSAFAIQVSAPTIGSENADRLAAQTSFTITNDNASVMTNVQVTFSGGAENTKYALQVPNKPTNISANSGVSVTLNGTIPLDHPSVDATTLKMGPVKIGVMTVTGTVGGQQVSQQTDVFMQAINQLEIKKTRVECSSTSKSIDDGDKITKLKPGEQCSLEIEVENNFDNDDTNNQKIGDISFDTVTIDVKSSNNDLDIEDADDIDNLDADDTDSVTMDLDFDEDASDGTYTVTVRVSSRDDNGALHGEALSFKMEISRLTHDVQITRAEVSPNRVDVCEASTVKVTAQILNQGKRNEDEVAVEVSVPDLKFIKKIENIELDQDDSTSVSFDVPVPAGTKAGLLRVDLKTYFDTLALSNQGSVDLTIDKCEADEPAVVVTPEQPKQETTVVVPTAPQATGTQAKAAAQKSSTTSFTDSPAYIALLVVLSVLIAGAIVAIIIALQKKKND